MLRLTVLAIVAVSSLASAASRDRVDALLERAPGLRRPVLEAALRAHDRAVAAGESASPLVTVIDYSLPSTDRRLWVLDTAQETLLFHELVSHGRGSGDLLAQRFSNVDESHESSLGVFVARETYRGQHGYSLRLDGLEPGFNDRARERAVVVHGAEYATPEFAAKRGRLGLSWGCPAVDPAVSRRLIDTLRDGTLVVAWYPDANWLKHSRYVCETASASAK